MRNSQIARTLGISTRTVEQHFVAMRRRAGAASRGELIARCYAAGILDQGVWPPGWSGARCLRIRQR
jgi:DNA-binding NarL/FixJ family response regulator